jgi:pimeloyl-ACP methyl ester carboxylesterase
LAERYTVVTLDLAGHGLSGQSRSPWTMDAFADDVEAVTRHLSNQRIFLVGHSVGGIVVLTAAQRDDPRIRGVIAIDQIRDVGAPLNDEQIALALEPFHRDFREHISNTMLRTAFVTSDDPALAQQIAAGMSSIDQTIAIKIIAEAARTDVSALLRTNTVPLSIINASHGGPTQTERLRALSPQLRNVMIMDDVGHFPMLTQSERFNDVLKSALAQLTLTTERAP